MKTTALESRADVAAILRLGEAGDTAMHDADIIVRARAYAEPHLRGQPLETGEDTLAHADAVAALLVGIGSAAELRAAVYLTYAADYIDQPEAAIGKAFGDTFATLVEHTRKLVMMLRSARDAPLGTAQRTLQTERIRKMLLAFSRDLRVVLLRLASRLQTLRFYAVSKLPCPPALAAESLQVFAPLANRLGIGQWKWELEDLSFRFIEPEQYKAVSRLLDERRVEREQGIEAFRARLRRDLVEHGIDAQVSGRPKHLYGIWKKMQAKGLTFAEVFDLRALRVIVDTVPECYAVLARVHASYPTVAGEFDDYIERPKSNGYQSLHTVVLDAQCRAVEVQIRTRRMHEQAEHGVAAHWAYKEAGTKGAPGGHSTAALAAQVAEARKAVLRQLLAWERDVAEQGSGDAAALDERIYVFTPQASVVELPTGATPVDFAYAVHTDLGHRCRGARVDGAMVTLNTPLRSGQTVEIAAVKEGGPSLDWLNGELGFLKAPRSKAKVRAWFNLLAQRDTIARGREAVEKLLQREGKTSIKLDELASQLGFRAADGLFEAVGKDEFSLRHIEVLLRPAVPLPTVDEAAALKHARARPQPNKGGVLVVGVDSLMTSLARCCRPAPPDAIGGYVTRGKGVGIHRLSCANFKQMVARSPERTIPVAWHGAPAATAVYAIDVVIEADDRQGLLRDISEVFAKEKVNVIGVRSESIKGHGLGTAFMTFTIEVSSSTRVAAVLAHAAKVAGVRVARRK